MAGLSRRVVSAGIASCAAVGAVNILAPAVATESTEISWAVINPGSFTTLVMEYMIKRQLDRKYGLRFPKPAVYTSVTTYYNDFVVGNYDLCMGSWDTLRPVTRPPFLSNSFVVLPMAI